MPSPPARELFGSSLVRRLVTSHCFNHSRRAGRCALRHVFVDLRSSDSFYFLILTS